MQAPLIPIVAVQPVRRWYDHLLLALGWRYLCHSLMLAAALVNEAQPAPHLPDRLLAWVSYTPWVHQHNYHLWLAAYLPLVFLLWRDDRRGAMHFLVMGGLLSLLRGLTVGLTGLGPVHGADLNAGLAGSELLGQWWTIVNPLAALSGDAAHIYLTKDLYFSGHTASTFLLLLYCWRLPKLRWWAVGAHLLVVATVFLAHLHYTIDVIGAWSITYCLFVAGQRWLPEDVFARSGG